MKKLAVILILLSLAGVVAVHAQDGNTRFQWEPYDFSLDLPVGWVTSASTEELILGLPEDVHAVEAGQTPIGVVVLVALVEPAPLERYVPPFNDSEVRMFGEIEWVTATIPPIGDRQGLTATRDTYLVTVSGPSATWPETLSIVTDLIASIEAPSLQRNLEAQLTQTVQWRHLKFRMPSTLEIRNGTPGLIIVSTENRPDMSQMPATSMSIHDFSPTRHLFTLETAVSFSSMYYQPETEPLSSVEPTTLTYLELGGFDTASITSIDPENSLTHQTIALRTPDSLYVWTIMANTPQWELTQRNLFEAILATLEYAE